MLTPTKYWRVPCAFGEVVARPPEVFNLGEQLGSYAAPPGKGHGLMIAAYDPAEQTGYLQWIGVILGGNGITRTVQWEPTSARIDVDTRQGMKFWASGPFGFASTKIADYGLHELWQEHFDLELRGCTPNIIRPTRLVRSSRQSTIAPERVNPIEIIGEPTVGPKAGVVYVLKSAMGCKVGRTNSVPNRMRAFGVKLPFIYTIPLCAWFDDCHAAEKRYHALFADKHINGEWFNLTDQDIQQIRLRA